MTYDTATHLSPAALAECGMGAGPGGTWGYNSMTKRRFVGCFTHGIFHVSLPFPSVCLPGVCIHFYYTDNLVNYQTDCSQILYVY